MHRFWLAACAVLIACNGDDDPVDTDVTDTDPVDEAHHDFASGTLPACSERGGEIAWQTWTWNQGAAEGTFVFVNGRTEYTDKYHHLIELLGDRPWNVVMWDHYGQGRSDGLRAHIDDIDAEYVCDMKAVLDAKADPTLPVAVVTHSTGGLVAARYEQLHPGTVDAYVMGSALFKHDFGDLSEEEARGAIATKVALGQAEVPFDTYPPRPECDDPLNDVTHDCELYEQFYHDPLTEIGAPTWGWLDATLRAQDAIWADVSTMPDPLLLFEAGEEIVVSEEAIAKMCDDLNEIAANRCERVVWEGDFHELFSEVDRAAIMARALTFIDARFAAQ